MGLSSSWLKSMLHVERSARLHDNREPACICSSAAMSAASICVTSVADLNASSVNDALDDATAVMTGQLHGRERLTPLL